MKLLPSEIRYSQDSIAGEFSDFKGSILDIFEDLVSGELTAPQMGRIEVGVYNGHWVAFEGNRRLFLFKKLEEIGMVNEIEVKRIKPNRYHISRKYTTTNGGTSIKVRGAPYIQTDLDRIVQKYRKTHTKSTRTKGYNYENELARSMRSLDMYEYASQETGSRTNSSCYYGNVDNTVYPASNAKGTRNHYSPIPPIRTIHRDAKTNDYGTVFGNIDDNIGSKSRSGLTSADDSSSYGTDIDGWFCVDMTSSEISDMMTSSTYGVTSPLKVNESWCSIL